MKSSPQDPVPATITLANSFARNHRRHVQTDSTAPLPALLLSPLNTTPESHAHHQHRQLQLILQSTLALLCDNPEDNSNDEDNHSQEGQERKQPQQ